MEAAEVATIYGTFLNRVILWLRKRGHVVDSKSHISHTVTHDDLVTVTLTEPIHCSEWPYDPKSSKKIHIVAEFEDVVCLRKEACIKTNLRVAYFHPKGGGVRAVECLHYDSQIPADYGHPICHVQCCSKVSLNRLPEMLREKYGYPIDDSLRGRCQTIRIPSAFVSFLSLFAVLAADHLPEGDWSAFLSEFRSTGDKCRLACGGQMDAIRKQSLSAWSWYEPRPPLMCRRLLTVPTDCTPAQCRIHLSET